MFNAESIRARLREQPFVPVRIITSSGQAYDITHPDLVWVGRNALMIGTASNDKPAYFDATSRVAILHVTDMQDLAGAAMPPTNTNGAV